jgi:colicin import membrane protein
MTQQLATPAGTPFVPPDSDPYRYGFRDVVIRRPDGTADMNSIPLTLDDVLHPQEGDFIVEKPIYLLEREYIASVLRNRGLSLTGFYLLSDCLVNWGMAGVRNHGPDVVIFTHLLREPDPRKGVFSVVDYGARPLLALELVSPHTRINDVERKFAQYYRVGVPRYILVDQEREDGPRQLIDYRRGPAGYEPAPLGKNGEVAIAELGVALSLVDNRVGCFDLVTGERLLDYQQLDFARQAAERLAREEAAARHAAQQRIQELEAELRKLRGESSA